MGAEGTVCDRIGHVISAFASERVKSCDGHKAEVISWSACSTDNTSNRPSPCNSSLPVPTIRWPNCGSGHSSSEFLRRSARYLVNAAAPMAGLMASSGESTASAAITAQPSSIIAMERSAHTPRRKTLQIARFLCDHGFRSRVDPSAHPTAPCVWANSFRYILKP